MISDIRYNTFSVPGLCDSVDLYRRAEDENARQAALAKIVRSMTASLDIRGPQLEAHLDEMIGFYAGPQPELSRAYGELSSFVRDYNATQAANAAATAAE